MSRVAAIGEAVAIQGFALAGVLLMPGDTPDEVLDAWRGLPGDVQVVFLTAPASAVLGRRPPGPLAVVMGG